MPGFKALKILLVEDNSYMRTIIREVLKGAGIGNIVNARDGAEGLELLGSHSPDIAIVDYVMAPLDGVDFTRTVRQSADSKNPYLPVIMVSGHSDMVRVKAARDAGVNEFITKPMIIRSLITRLNNVVMKPRPYIRCQSFIGPDRRRRADANFQGPYQRNSDGLI